MALTRDRLRDTRDDRLRPVPGPGPAPAPGRLHAWATETDVVPRRWRLGLLVAWATVYTAAVLLEPAPADPGAPDPVWAVALFLTLAAALGAMGAGLRRGRRAGLVAGVAAAGLAALSGVLCPVSSHHTAVGAWWYLQMAGFTALMGVTLGALRASRAPAPPVPPSRTA